MMLDKLGRLDVRNLEIKNIHADDGFPFNVTILPVKDKERKEL